MQVSRRGFLKISAAGISGLAAVQLGIDLTPIKAYAAATKLEGSKEAISICPFCSCGCNVLVHSKDGKIINVEGDPDFPISDGGLCAKGASLKSLHMSPERLTKPLYRAPYSDKWEEKDWGWMMERIAQRIKEQRDKDFKVKNAQGQTVNRVESLFHLGSSQVSNEEAAVLHQMVRALGIVHFDHQARICHSPSVPALAECFGRGAMTNHYNDIMNADAILIMGSNCAEHHPMTFKWVLRAKENNNAVVMHVDPKFSRTSARSTFHVPIRSGTDIAFLGGMIKYIIDQKKYFEEFVLEYTNASFIVGSKYSFTDGVFSGFDPKTKTYDKSTWAFEKDAQGLVKRDKTLKDPRCVFNVMKAHYARYTPETVSKVTGVSKEDLLRVYEAYAATGRPDKAGTVIYALGWTQHSVGVQNIRASGLIQQLLGNVGIAGGGINALRGEPNVQGTTDHALLYGYLPGYHTTPSTKWPTLESYLAANTPKTADPMSVNWWGNRPKYLVSLLKSWYGEHATKENDFCYAYVPKLDAGVDYSHLYIFDRMYKKAITGGLCFGHNPCQSIPNIHKVRKAWDGLDWVAIADVFHNETTDNWHRPGVDPKKIKTEVFLLPSAYRAEKEGTISNSGRWMMWHYKAVEPRGQSRDMGSMIVEIMSRVKNLYAKGGAFPEPIINADFPTKFDAEEITRRVNGHFTRDTVINGKEYKKGQLVPGFASLMDDGSTTSMCWVYCGCFTEKDGNLSKRRDLTQTARQAKIGLFPGFSWAWPMNRRILYNRASVDKNGVPYNPERVVIAWEDGKWVGDVPDGGNPPMAQKGGTYPFIMTTDGHSQFYGPGREDGPLPEHYEPAETPLVKNPFSGQMHNPCMKVIESDMDKLAKHGDPRFPIVLTTYSLTEHWCSGSETRNAPPLLEAEPQQYVEMSHELAKEKGVKNGDVVIVESLRGKTEAVAMVTVRVRPFKVMGKTLHLVGMPFCFGWSKPKCGDSTNRVTLSIGDPNTTIPEYKACLVNLYKAEKATEL